MRKGVLAVVLFWLSGAAMAAIEIDVLARTCNNCHGVSGVSVGHSMPSIGGLPREYLKTVMKQWKYDERGAATMNRIVKGFSDDEIDALAIYFSKKRWVPVPQSVGASLLAKGKAAISENCEDCHGFTGSDPDEDAPKINGQWAKYMQLELDKYRDDGFKMPHRKMKKTARKMKPADVPAAAHYYGAQSK
jgi:cytochrome subunit of sulfide dehydrogenase